MLTMKKFPAIICVLSFIATSACTGASVRNAARAQNQAYKAQEDVAEQRLKLVEQYQQCVAEAGSNLAKVEACDTYLKSAEALS